VLLDGGVEVMVGDAVGVSEGELDELSGTVLGSGPAAGAGLLVEQPPSTAIPSNAAAAPGFQTGWIVTASPPFASLSPAAANAPGGSGRGGRSAPNRAAAANRPRAQRRLVHPVGLGLLEERPRPAAALRRSGAAPAGAAWVASSHLGRHDLLDPQVQAPVVGEVVVIGEALGGPQTQIAPYSSAAI